MRGGHVLRRRAARVASAVLLAAVAATVVAQPGAEAQTPPPTITATPTTDLTDASVIDITGSGFSPSTSVLVFQCGPRYVSGSPDVLSHCQFNLVSGGSTDADGDLVPTTFNPDPVLYLREQVFVDGQLTYVPYIHDCRVSGGCQLEVGDFNGRRATVPLSFAPDGPLAGTVAAAPTSDLVDAQVLTITGSGLNFGASILTARQCIDDPARGVLCEPRRSNNRQAQAGGTIVPLQYRVDAVVSSEQQPGIRSHDCRTAGRCLLRVGYENDPTEPVFDIPLAFDPSAPLTPPPPVTVTPNQDLIHDEQVTVRGEGYAVGEPLEMRVCGPGSTWYESCYSLGPAYTNLDGTFTATPRVPAGFADAVGTVDCRTAPEPCQLLVSPNALSSRLARVDLHFDPEGPDPTDPNAPPTLSVSPAGDLDHLETVQVSGRGFHPSIPNVRVQICPDDPAGLPYSCLDLRRTVSDRAGKVDLAVKVPAEFEPVGGGAFSDCRVAPGCRLVVTGDGQRVETGVLTFTPRTHRRYVDRITDDVKLTPSIPYRTTTNVYGQPVTLVADVYEPAEDSVAERPVIVWVDETFFAFTLRPFFLLAGPTARDFARRGYVVVVLKTRVRPALDNQPYFGNTTEVDAAARDDYDDLTAGLAWLRDHAADYRIEPDAIAVSGIGAGGIDAFNLAYMPGQRGPATSQVAAAVPISGFNMGTPEPGEPPVLAIHGSDDEYFPVARPQSACDAATEAELRCDVLTLDGVNHQLLPTGDGAAPFFGRQAERVQATVDFLAEVMLDFDVSADAGGPHSVVEGSTLTLDGSGSSGEGLAYSWAPADRVDDPASATPKLRGIDDGTETLTLTVTDTHGVSDSASVEVTTTNAPPTIPVLDLQTSPPDQTVNLQAGITDPGPVDTHAVVADWGDGTTSPLAVGDGAANGSHAYAEPGRYTVEITATDDDGASATAERQVVVGCTIVGTDRNDLLVGTRGPDVICGLGGHDLIAGLDGNDRIYGGPGNDLLLGGRGNDHLIGGPGLDWALGDQGTDTCTAELRLSCSPPR